MNARARLAFPNRAIRIVILGLGCLLFADYPTDGARAQSLIAGGTPSESVSRARDYYARYTDPATADFLRTVERYHLADSFWRYYREGQFNSVRSDLNYVFDLFPNHPKALHLIAYDKNIGIEPSEVIQRFEFAIRAFPGHAYTYAQYGRYLMSIGRKKVGTALLEEALQMDPTLVVARAWLAEDQPTQPPSEAEPYGTGPARNKSSAAPGNPPRRAR